MHSASLSALDWLSLVYYHECGKCRSPLVMVNAPANHPDVIKIEWLKSFSDYPDNFAPLMDLLPSRIEMNGQRRPPSGQIGTICVAIPRCPDCVNCGNVCRGVEQFYPGATYFLGARKDMVRRCKEANALD